MKKKFYDRFDDEFVEEFKDLVKKNKSIVIVSHKSPDDDSISSVLGIYVYLTEFLKIDEAKIRMIYSGKKTESWNYFKNYEKVEFVNDISEELKEENLLIILDASGWMRLSNDQKINGFKGTTICIDHHPRPENKFDLHMVVTPCSSCAEMIYRLFFEKERLLNKETCEILLLGMIGDTGVFKFVDRKTSSILKAANKLVDMGEVSIQELCSKFQKYSQESYEVLKELMKNSTFEEIDGWPKFIYSFVDLDFVKKNGFDDNMISQGSGLFVHNFTREVVGVDWGFSVTPKLITNDYSISVRSLPGSVSARAFMERTKFGGGHDRAAGGKIAAENLRQALKIMMEWMKNNKPKLS